MNEIALHQLKEENALNVDQKIISLRKECDMLA